MSDRLSSLFLDALAARVLVADGAMGTALQAHDLSLDDFAGLEGCNEIFNVTRPDVVRSVHRGYPAAGADAVESGGRPRLRYWLDRLTAGGVLAHAAVIYGYFPCVAEGDDLVVLTEPAPGAPERLRFTFPRQRRDRRLCLADCYRPRVAGQVDVVPFTVVTMGQPIAGYSNELFAADAYRLTEALAEYWHRRIRQKPTLPGGVAVASADPRDVEEFFELGYRGARFSPGYGACPDLEDRAKIVALLEPGRIGVKLSEKYQLHPGQPTDAIVCHHPEAKYFTT
jgi:5-methyltetrahydrofolate--homocysteine methyltransferase